MSEPPVCLHLPSPSPLLLLLYNCSLLTCVRRAPARHRTFLSFLPQCIFLRPRSVAVAFYVLERDEGLGSSRSTWSKIPFLFLPGWQPWSRKVKKPCVLYRSSNPSQPVLFISLSLLLSLLCISLSYFRVLSHQHGQSLIFFLFCVPCSSTFHVSKNRAAPRFAEDVPGRHELAIGKWVCVYVCVCVRV